MRFAGRAHLRGFRTTAPQDARIVLPRAALVGGLLARELAPGVPPLRVRIRFFAQESPLFSEVPQTTQLHGISQFGLF